MTPIPLRQRPGLADLGVYSRREIVAAITCRY